MVKKSLRAVAVAATLAASAVGAQAADYTVGAVANSSTGGVGLDTISLLIGQSFSVSASLTDLWNAGALPRWSNANGLTGNAFATGSDESGQPVTTQISQDFGLYNQGNLSAAYGSLVGQIGAGDFFKLGTSFSGTANASGVLKLYYWDSNAGDNSGSIVASVTAVPEPETYALMLAGLGAVGFMARRRRNV